MAHIKLNKENLFYNLKELCLKAGNKSKIAAVLKDNAYGHGIQPMAKMLQEFGITQAVVMNNNEASQIQENFEQILILNDAPLENSNFSYAITSLEQLQNFPSRVKLELKVDTGMHRNGISPEELEEALAIIQKKGLTLFGVFTHFKGADEFDTTLSWQKRNFEEVKQKVVAKGFCPRFHSHNSAALLRSKAFSEDIARVGIAMYGYNEVPLLFDTPKLKPVLSLWAKRVSTRVLKKGQRVGYGGDFIAPKDMVVSTYDVGYGDGLFRGSAKNPLHTANNLPILGRVSMDFITLESTKEELCIFDDAQKIAKHFNTISYEIVTALKSSIEREII